jgi:hypothetical protein
MKPNTPVTKAPMMYIALRPIRSDRCPNSGIETKDTTEATSTAVSRKSRETCSVPVPYEKMKAVKM